jgi:hypothetical protein
MGRDRFCCLRRMITGLATMTVERLNARVVLNTRITLVVDLSMNHHLAAVHSRGHFNRWGATGLVAVASCLAWNTTRDETGTHVPCTVYRTPQ